MPPAVPPAVPPGVPPAPPSTSARTAEPRRARRGSGAVTLHDVAKLAGVAPITASRALNTPDQVSDDVRQRVRDAVSRTGYVPNRLAGGLASARSRVVAAVVPTVSGLVFLQTVQALTQSLADAGYQLMLGQSGYAGLREDALLEAFIGRRPDGIVLTGILHSSDSRRRLLACGIPVVETWDLTPTPIDMLVGFSHLDVGRTVARFLHGKGRRRFGVVAGDDERARRRVDAFRAEAQLLGLPAVEVALVPAPTTLKSGRDGLARLMQAATAQRQSATVLGQAAPALDAVFCSSDLLALGVITEARVRGWPVPAQLAVVGFGDLEFAADVAPALTTVHIMGAAIGRQAAQFIIDRAEGHTVAQPVVDIGFHIIERAST